MIKKPILPAPKERMEQNFRDRQKKGFDNLRQVRDITMALMILGIGLIVLFADALDLSLEIDNMMRYMFGGLCVLYGGFRLYRGIKRDY